MVITKSEALRRIGSLLQRLHGVKTPGSSVTNAVLELEFEVARLEDEHAKMVDDFMAGQLRKHNVKPVQFDVNGLSGRWQSGRKRAS